MGFDKDVKQYLSRVKKIKDNISTLAEEQTKHALVMPFFQMLGYDIFDTNEFMPEFVCDFGIKKDEKIDYAILRNDEPIMIIEVKRAGLKLQKQQQGQLFRYFATNRCRIAILTNGITYQVFSDLNTPNVMDDEPFLSFNLIEDDPTIYTPLINEFRKKNFNVENIVSNATIYKKYEKMVEKTLKQDLICPSDELVRYFLSKAGIKTNITEQMMKEYCQITQQAMQNIFKSNPQNSISEFSEEISNINIPEPPSISKIINEFKNILEPIVDEFSIIEEDNNEYCKLHMYTSQNRKIGIVKISKSDFTMQLRKLGNPESYTLKSIEDIKNYINLASSKLS